METANASMARLTAVSSNSKKLIEKLYSGANLISINMETSYNYDIIKADKKIRAYISERAGDQEYSI
jgi:hypothetical protein